jgi:type IV pilus assembly protein PilV
MHPSTLINLKDQSGMMLLEALIAILIFSLGILGMVAINARAVEAATDSQARADAAKFTSEIASRIALAVDRSSKTNLDASLKTFQHQPGGGTCVFTGTESDTDVVKEWKSTVLASGKTGLPGATASGLRILVVTPNDIPPAFNRVSITICWQQPGVGMRQHELISYVN